MRGRLAWFLGLSLAANGLAMLAVPADWYAVMPGVADSGPFNPHFVRDIGVAYLVSGSALVAFAMHPAARAAAPVSTAFLVLHAGVHLWDAAAGREHAHQLLLDVPTIFLPAILALWVAWSPRHNVNEGEER